MENKNSEEKFKMKSSADNTEQNNTHRAKRKWWEIRRMKKNEEKTLSASHIRSMDSTVASYFLLKDPSNGEGVEKEDGIMNENVSFGGRKFTSTASTREDAESVNKDVVKKGDACRVTEIKSTSRERNMNIIPKASSKVFDDTHEKEKRNILNRPLLNPLTQLSTLNQPGGNHHAFTKSVGYSSKDVNFKHPCLKLETSTDQAIEQETAPILQRSKGFTKSGSEDEMDTNLEWIDESNTNRFQDFEDEYEEEMAYRFPTLYRRLAIMKAEDPNLIPQVNMLVPKAKVPYDNPNLRVISPCHERRSNKKQMPESGARTGNVRNNSDLEASVDDTDHLLELQSRSPSKYLRQLMQQKNSVPNLINAKSEETFMDEIQSVDQILGRNSSPSVSAEEKSNVLRRSTAKKPIAIKEDDQVTQDIERLIMELVSTEPKTTRKSSLQYSRHGQHPDDFTDSLDWLLGEIGM